jgi:hypothetical protein
MRLGMRCRAWAWKSWTGAVLLALALALSFAPARQAQAQGIEDCLATFGGPYGQLAAAMIEGKDLKDIVGDKWKQGEFMAKHGHCAAYLSSTDPVFLAISGLLTAMQLSGQFPTGEEGFQQCTGMINSTIAQLIGTLLKEALTTEGSPLKPIADLLSAQQKEALINAGTEKLVEIASDILNNTPGLGFLMSYLNCGCAFAASGIFEEMKQTVEGAGECSSFLVSCGNDPLQCVNGLGAAAGAIIENFAGAVADLLKDLASGALQDYLKEQCKKTDVCDALLSAFDAGQELCALTGLCGVLESGVDAVIEAVTCLLGGCDSGPSDWKCGDPATGGNTYLWCPVGTQCGSAGGHHNNACVACPALPHVKSIDFSSVSSYAKSGCGCDPGFNPSWSAYGQLLSCDCKEGMEYNPATDQCLCPLGKVLVSPVALEAHCKSCGPRTHPDESRTFCQACGANQVVSADGLTCTDCTGTLGVNTAGTACIGITCTGGKIRNSHTASLGYTDITWTAWDDTCKCPDGQYEDPNGICQVKIDCGPWMYTGLELNQQTGQCEPMCDPGLVYKTTGEGEWKQKICEPCEDKSLVVRNNKCVPCTAPGTTNNGNNSCTPICKEAGFAYNEKTGSCDLCGADHELIEAAAQTGDTVGTATVTRTCVPCQDGRNSKPGGKCSLIMCGIGQPKIIGSKWDFSYKLDKNLQCKPCDVGYKVSDDRRSCVPAWPKDCSSLGAGWTTDYYSSNKLAQGSGFSASGFASLSTGARATSRTQSDGWTHQCTCRFGWHKNDMGDCVGGETVLPGTTMLPGPQTICLNDMIPDPKNSGKCICKPGSKRVGNSCAQVANVPVMTKGTVTGAEDNKKSTRSPVPKKLGGEGASGTPALAKTCPPGRVPNRAGTACLIDLGDDGGSPGSAMRSRSGGPAGTPAFPSGGGGRLGR